MICDQEVIVLHALNNERAGFEIHVERELTAETMLGLTAE